MKLSPLVLFASLLLAACAPAPETTEAVAAALGDCAERCNSDRIAGESTCDRAYDPDGQPALNSGCVTLVFQRYEQCVSRCDTGAQTIEN